MVNFRTKILILVSLSLTSCSWMSKRAALFEEGETGTPAVTKASDVKPSVVPKEQYDQLLTKYESLLDKVKNAETTANDDIMNSPSAKQGQMIEQLSKINPPADLAETVDVFGKDGITSNIPDDVLDNTPKSKLSDSDVEMQLRNLQRANQLVAENKMDAALILLKDLEESSNKQIRVRAKYYLGEMLFRQNEYDLAMQIYEDIIKNYAFSGLVIKSLGRLIVCTEKLKMDKKRERYYSILHDFFEAA